MTAILLIDLDDTLLQTSTDQFVRAYLGKLGTFLGDVAGISPEVMVQNIMRATSAMIQNHRPDVTLQEVFNRDFYPSLGFDYEDLQPQVEEFYRRVYPTLQPITQPISDAQQAVDLAMEKGWRIAIATNPIFPATAVRQRLEWAGFPATEYPFELVGSFEHMHFTKPNPAYYAEIVARLGCPEVPIIMAGNDLGEDILPARDAGFNAYWIKPADWAVENPLDGQIPYGSMSDFVEWMGTVQLASLQDDCSGVKSTLAQMEATPAALATMLRDVSDEYLSKRPAEGEWSLTEIFCHLRDVECEVNLPRLALFEREENPFLPAEDTDRWAEQRRYIQQDGQLALKEFTKARMQALEKLSLLTDSGWERTSRHAIFGQTTIKDLFSFVATHDRLHIRQAYPLIKAYADSTSKLA